ncbi:DUF2505 domain-containing protein [Nocardia cyriacigeorgica]|uniref:Protein of uncharacterized function (DUF2505) n=1 Tax=Nocardia cyriacigeorgica TaxID=135487 RepID=A0A4U8W2B5_9NOCA|nr:DUF2505 domain-containing protein [Nocardia cyriacigeorgica]MBF6159731.1 DUF2505 domain-containing protein [Nocardia cyriacigeorgica]MBF6198814.1 DUF2505 domain-containing protein [Nocardia cyriacigeorgica]MBF6342383.1 DUF2505 domain-containing protein [Nocardia cyriacigeorgica]MBF6518500.1 DUF2505 domain-containing protein [Nocardia cyriacigeorgica]VFB00013.1 Protein of uncharacterised function (DUF2505) [Nocardia cyriacigeorgica]
MARRLDYSARYPLHTTKELYAALSNRDYWEARMEEMRKYSPNEVISLESNDDGIEVVLHHILPRDTLPDIAQTVIRKDMVITRKESYGPFGPEVEGKYSASIPAGPGSLTGTMRLFPTETGCTMRFSSEAKVFIPMVGPRLEQLMLVNLVDLFRAEAEVTQRWLEEQNPTS